MLAKASKIILLPALVAMTLSGCNDEAATTAKPAVTANASGVMAEKELARQAKAYQRTIAQGVGTGIVLGGILGSLNNNTKTGINIGIGAGAFAGTYVAALQARYISKERKLEKIRDDINASNASLAASIATMQTVLDLQRVQLATIRAQAGNNAELTREVAEAEANLSNMRSTINSASNWEKEYKSTRSLKLVDQQLTGIDTEIAHLSQRIETMRKIADTLATAI